MREALAVSRRPNGLPAPIAMRRMAGLGAMGALAGKGSKAALAAVQQQKAEADAAISAARPGLDTAMRKLEDVARRAQDQAAVIEGLASALTDGSGYEYQGQAQSVVDEIRGYLQDARGAHENAIDAERRDMAACAANFCPDVGSHAAYAKVLADAVAMISSYARKAEASASTLPSLVSRLQRARQQTAAQAQAEAQARAAAEAAARAEQERIAKIEQQSAAAEQAKTDAQLRREQMEQQYQQALLDAQQRREDALRQAEEARINAQLQQQQQLMDLQRAREEREAEREARKEEREAALQALLLQAELGPQFMPQAMPGAVMPYGPSPYGMPAAMPMPGMVPAGTMGPQAFPGMPGMPAGFFPPQAMWGPAQPQQPEYFNPGAEMFGLGALQAAANPSLPPGSMIEEGYMVEGPVDAPQIGGTAWKFTRPDGTSFAVPGPAVAGKIVDPKTRSVVFDGGGANAGTATGGSAADVISAAAPIAQSIADVFRAREERKIAKYQTRGMPAMPDYSGGGGGGGIPGWVMGLGVLAVGAVIVGAVAKGKKK